MSQKSSSDAGDVRWKRANYDDIIFRSTFSDELHEWARIVDRGSAP